MAQDKPSEKPAEKPSEKPPANPGEDEKLKAQREAEAAAREAILKKIKAEAERAGIKTDNPVGPAPQQPAATPPAKPQPPAATPPATGVAPTPTQPGKTAIPTAPGTFRGVQPPSRPGVAPGGIRPGVPTAHPTPAGAAGATPVQAIPLSQPGPDDDLLINITENVEIVQLVDYMQRELHIQLIYVDGGLFGRKVFFPTPIHVKRSDLMGFIMSLLEQNEYAMWQDPATEIYYVGPKNYISPQFGGKKTEAPQLSALTRIIRTPNIKPSSLQASITSLLTAGRGGQAGTQPVYMDDLGIIMMTDSPRITQLIEEFVDMVVKERDSMKFYPFDLQNISAVSAKDRVLELLGLQAQR
ncbi:MAG TPA: hypothetical protein VHC70_11670, partial [Phycisphaerales bacterium]|nr:hypothetical protein [Phycisphaerales bacterium]